MLRPFLIQICLYIIIIIFIILLIEQLKLKAYGKTMSSSSQFLQTPCFSSLVGDADANDVKVSVKSISARHDKVREIDSNCLGSQRWHVKRERENERERQKETEGGGQEEKKREKGITLLPPPLKWRPAQEKREIVLSIAADGGGVHVGGGVRGGSLFLGSDGFSDVGGDKPLLVLLPPAVDRGGEMPFHLFPRRGGRIEQSQWHSECGLRRYATAARKISLLWKSKHKSPWLFHWRSF